MQEGTATQWPGDPGPAWTSTAWSALPLLDRSVDVPRPESVNEVARWKPRTGLGRTELVYAPICWALLPLGAFIYAPPAPPEGRAETEGMNLRGVSTRREATRA